MATTPSSVEKRKIKEGFYEEVEEQVAPLLPSIFRGDEFYKKKICNAVNNEVEALVAYSIYGQHNLCLDYLAFPRAITMRKKDKTKKSQQQQQQSTPDLEPVNPINDLLDDDEAQPQQAATMQEEVEGSEEEKFGQHQQRLFSHIFKVMLPTDAEHLGASAVSIPTDLLEKNPDTRKALKWLDNDPDFEDVLIHNRWLVHRLPMERTGKEPIDIQQLEFPDETHELEKRAAKKKFWSAFSTVVLLLCLLPLLNFFYYFGVPTMQSADFVFMDTQMLPYTRVKIPGIQAIEETPSRVVFSGTANTTTTTTTSEDLGHWGYASFAYVDPQTQNERMITLPVVIRSIHPSTRALAGLPVRHASSTQEAVIDAEKAASAASEPAIVVTTEKEEIVAKTAQDTIEKITVIKEEVRATGGVFEHGRAAPHVYHARSLKAFVRPAAGLNLPLTKPIPMQQPTPKFVLEIDDTRDQMIFFEGLALFGLWTAAMGYSLWQAAKNFSTYASIPLKRAAEHVEAVAEQARQLPQKLRQKVLKQEEQQQQQQQQPSEIEQKMARDRGLAEWEEQQIRERREGEERQRQYALEQQEKARRERERHLQHELQRQREREQQQHQHDQQQPDLQAIARTQRKRTVTPPPQQQQQHRPTTRSTTRAASSTAPTAVPLATTTTRPTITKAAAATAAAAATIEATEQPVVSTTTTQTFIQHEELYSTEEEEEEVEDITTTTTTTSTTTTATQQLSIAETANANPNNKRKATSGPVVEEEKTLLEPRRSKRARPAPSGDRV